MKFNPRIHHRRSIRLKGYDYSKAGAYFITINCHKGKHRFGKIVVDEQSKEARMELNEFGIIAYNEWIKLQERFATFELDVFQIMPNHMHGIIILNDGSNEINLSSDAKSNLSDARAILQREINKTQIQPAQAAGGK